MEETLQSSVLIVDDSSTNIRVVMNMIAHLDYQVHIAKNGLQALKLLSKLKPSVILMDIQMPDMNGFECCQRIKKSISHASIPIIFLSGSNDDKDKLKAKKLGGDAYITKPINGDELLEKLDFHMPWS
jgi:CheY-like chemotaxis protein